MTRSVVQLGGQALKLDADGDTTIEVSSDDVLVVDTAGNEALKIDASGHITKPLQSAFSAECGTTHTNISTGSTTIIIDTERFDQNGDFNTSNYTFTAPVTGKYQFTWAVNFSDIGGESASGFSYMAAILDTSNIDYEVYFDFAIGDKTADNTTLTGSALADMDENDTAILKIYNNMGSTTGDIAGDSSQMSTYLTGYLVC